MSTGRPWEAVHSAMALETRRDMIAALATEGERPPPGEPAAYRFVVLGVSTVVNALAWGARASFALFFVAILAEFSWGRGPTALGYSLSWLCFVLFAPVAGWLQDRCGARAIVAIGGVTPRAPLSFSPPPRPLPSSHP